MQRSILNVQRLMTVLRMFSVCSISDHCNWHWHCSLFSKNLTRNTFPLSITSIRIQDTTRKQFTSQNIARISSHKISSIRRFVLFHSATTNRSHPFVQPNLPKQYVIVFGSSSFSSNLLLKLLPLT